ncbi:MULTISPECIES: hypothetical protein [Frankia]|uniref:Uncharacterized protein n=1 Tax=Frankia alni (strain DSM 45986 / CECT 9034 / ACN14a) TaxID=326424 RepID=Q0RLL6_FRAAA|nr:MULTISPECIES: hypothetical protein [Frankia]CAJ61588.1 conserved hypothetical protein [Frankia alni ACN14a]
MIRAAPACAPACRFVRADGDVVVSYRYAGTVHALLLPGPVWTALVDEARRDRLARLGETWQRWESALAVGCLRLHEGHVELIHGHVRARHVRLPASVWEQIVAAMRSHALDHLSPITTTPGS